MRAKYPGEFLVSCIIDTLYYMSMAALTKSPRQNGLDGPFLLGELVRSYSIN